MAALVNRLASSPHNCTTVFIKPMDKVADINTRFIAHPPKYLYKSPINTIEPVKRITQTANKEYNHFFPLPSPSSISALSAFATQLSFRLNAMSTKMTCWKMMKNTAPTLKILTMIRLKSGSFGMKIVATTNIRKIRILAAQASRLAVGTFHAAIPEKVKKSAADEATR